MCGWSALIMKIGLQIHTHAHTLNEGRRPETDQKQIIWKLKSRLEYNNGKNMDGCMFTKREDSNCTAGCSLKLVSPDPFTVVIPSHDIDEQSCDSLTL